MANNTTKKIDTTTPFIIVKPEGMKYLKRIVDFYYTNKVKIYKAYFVSNWELLSRNIYLSQLEKANDNLRTRFENHIYLNKVLFGNKSYIFLLDMLDNNIIDIQMIKRLKDECRKLLCDDCIKISINSNKILYHNKYKAS